MSSSDDFSLFSSSPFESASSSSSSSPDEFELLLDWFGWTSVVETGTGWFSLWLKRDLLLSFDRFECDVLWLASVELDDADPESLYQQIYQTILSASKLDNFYLSEPEDEPLLLSLLVSLSESLLSSWNQKKHRMIFWNKTVNYYTIEELKSQKES